MPTSRGMTAVSAVSAILLPLWPALLRRHTEYGRGIEEGSRLADMFWSVLASMTPQEQAMFLRFTYEQPMGRQSTLSSSCFTPRPLPPLCLSWPHCAPSPNFPHFAPDARSSHPFHASSCAPQASPCTPLALPMHPYALTHTLPLHSSPVPHPRFMPTHKVICLWSPLTLFLGAFLSTCAGMRGPACPPLTLVSRATSSCSACSRCGRRVQTTRSLWLTPVSSS